MAALLSQSLLRLQNEHTGFALDQVTIQTAPFHLLGRQGDERLDLYDRMVERIGRSVRASAPPPSRGTRR